MPNNFAFIDGNNVHLGIGALGWKLDWKRFRVHLLEYYGVSRAYYFLGYLPEHQDLYNTVEPLGSEILLDTRVGNHTIVARVDPTVRTKPHDKIRLAFIPDRIHFFDNSTDDAIA